MLADEQRLAARAATLLVAATVTLTKSVLNETRASTARTAACFHPLSAATSPSTTLLRKREVSMPADMGMGKSFMLSLLAERMSEEHKLPASDRPDTKAYEESLVESLAEDWRYLDQWAIRGEGLFAVNALAERQAQQAAPAMSPSRPRRDGGV
ncbi:hypothetical protein OG232_03920 [Streptomyces sp. NBC_01411]|uniref:hypothetical protein n=1 Tax=Streptomyces sp. NBC_01411 TaxID=2903857 RepID=UPI00324C56B4